MNHGAVVATLGLLVACGGGAGNSVHHPGEEWLDSVRIEGTHAVPERLLVEGLALYRVAQAEHAPDGYLIAMDADRIRGEYLRRGYLDIAVDTEVAHRGDAATITYRVREGARSTTRFEIEGLPPEVSVEQVRALVPLADAAPFSYDKLSRAKPKLLELVQDAGYAHVLLDTQLVADRANRTITIRLTYFTGPRCVFGKTVITGTTDLHDAVAERVAIAEGQPYSNRALATTRAALHGMQRFASVRVEGELGDPSLAVVPVRVALRESGHHEVKLGAGVGVDPVAFEVRGRAAYELEDWPAPLDTVGLEFRPAYAYLRDGDGFEPRLRALARLDHRDLLATDVHGTVEVGYDYLTVEAYTSYGPRGALGVSVPFGHGLQLRAGWAIERLEFRRVNALIDAPLQQRLGLDRSERVGGFNQLLVLDLRDNRIEPRLGVYAELRATEGTTFAGGAFTYFEVQPELRGYVPLGPLVIAARARMGAILGDAPVTERFFSGGSTSQRGFSERQLSPFVAGEVDGHVHSIPYGGAGLVETGLEARFPIYHVGKMPLGGVAFVDGGDVTDTTSALGLGHLNWAAGVGLRLHTVIGPARLDFGYRLNRTGAMDPEPGSRFAVHLSLGEAF